MSRWITQTQDGGTIEVAGEAVSRDELFQRATALAVAEVRGATTVALEATPTLETVVGVVACLLAGVPFVPIAPDAGPMERDHVLEDSGADLVLAPGAQRPNSSGSTPLPEPPEDAAAMIVYTSGTTGPPKGVVLSHRAIAADLDALADAWAWTADDVLVQGLPLFHVHGLVLGVLGALRTGSRLVHTGRPTPEAYAKARGTLYFGVPTVWSRMVEDRASAEALSSARLLVSGSAALPTPVFDRLTQLTGHQPVERYGMTETLITLSTRADGERRPGWVGLPVRGIETRVVGDEPGELQVKGPTLFDGYRNRIDATAACFTADGWFQTGDAAVIDEGGFHRIVGRQSTDIIKTGGFKVGAGEVEAALLAHPGVREAAVVGRPDPDLGQRIVAYVVGDGVDAVALEAFVAEQLSVHKRPRQVHLVDQLPRNAMGKVQKTLLPG